ncbi:MAG: RNA methyltransferase [Spirochaetaceae bacterium]|jgi:tRNA/rRNA methyltransferase/tRNA (cytidine32/uridine32-2'-O)-methyltransferase|nr:RNA methyltransferase [Spirochaetaceae bacterium]
MKLKDVRIVLCRPSEPGNVGAVCRAMKNMGLSSLRLVAPLNMDDELIRARTVHAEDIWEGALYFETLREALADCSLAIGTSRRRGKRRKDISLAPREAALYLKNYPATENFPAALVFGNERTGLENEELALCTLSSHIPANDAFPSLNLSHAVQVYAYELAVALSPDADKPQRGKWEPVPQRTIDELCTSICDSLSSIGFYTHTARDEQHDFFRDIFSRAALTEFESGHIQKIFRKAARLTNEQ